MTRINSERSVIVKNKRSSTGDETQTQTPSLQNKIRCFHRDKLLRSRAITQTCNYSAIAHYIQSVSFIISASIKKSQSYFSAITAYAEVSETRLSADGGILSEDLWTLLSFCPTLSRGRNTHLMSVSEHPVVLLDFN